MTDSHLSDTLPPLRQCFRPLLAEMAKGFRSTRECLPGLAAHFNLSKEAQEELLPSGGRTRLFDTADWAHLALFKTGLTRRISRGVYEITPEGHDALTTGPKVFDEQYFRTFAKYLAWKNRASPADKTPRASVATKLSTNEDETPEDRIRAAHVELDAALADDLLQAVLQTTPARFERLVIELLISMGYGNGDAAQGKAIGKSGDGGIDGIVNEDALGLDAVYIQAKLYAPGNTVGRPALQGFVGSMTGESATKGVFVTTSSFSQHAVDYLPKIAQRVVLIDGPHLARLMIAHGVGVREEDNYVIRAIDTQFFGDD